MNRIATQTITFSPPPASSQSSISLPLDEVFRSSGFGRDAEAEVQPSSRPAVFCPLHYEPRYAYPLIVWLHDAGENEQALRRVVPRISLRNYVAVAPRGTALGSTPDANEHGAWTQDADGVEQADELVADAVQYVCGSLNVSSHRIFVAGQGEGGTMAVRLAFEHPQRFAGAISLDGLLPRQGLPLARLKELRQIPLLLSVRATESLDQWQLREDERLLHTAGVPYTLQQHSLQACPGEGDRSRMLAELDRWIMSHVCGAPVADDLR